MTEQRKQGEGGYHCPYLNDTCIYDLTDNVACNDCDIADNWKEENDDRKRNRKSFDD